VYADDAAALRQAMQGTTAPPDPPYRSPVPTA
jgi:hypothetical protein